MLFSPQKPVCQAKIFFWMAPSMTRMRPKAASWVRTPKATPRPPAISADAEEDGEGFGHANVFGAGRWVFEVTVAAGDEDEADHEAHEEQAEVGEAG